MFSKTIATFFLLSLVILFYEQKIALWLFTGYFVLSVLTLLLYGIDKYNAVKDKRRVSEKTLQLWALFGGWPGALIAQQIFRHKTKKRPFIIVLWLGVFTNVAVFGLYQYLNFQYLSF
jgi:uncharacterized membrane protein YsdA (DUF1294 family)